MQDLSMKTKLLMDKIRQKRLDNIIEEEKPIQIKRIKRCMSCRHGWPMQIGGIVFPHGKGCEKMENFLIENNIIQEYETDSEIDT